MSESLSNLVYTKETQYSMQLAEFWKVYKENRAFCLAVQSGIFYKESDIGSKNTPYVATTTISNSIHFTKCKFTK